MNFLKRKQKDTQPQSATRERGVTRQRTLYTGLAASAALLAACAPTDTDPVPNEVSATQSETYQIPSPTRTEQDTATFETVDQAEAAAVVTDVLSRLRDPEQWQQDEFCPDDVSVCLTSTQLLDDRGRAGYSRVSYLRVMQDDGNTIVEFNQALLNDLTSDNEAHIWGGSENQR